MAFIHMTSDILWKSDLPGKEKKNPTNDKRESSLTLAAFCSDPDSGDSTETRG